MEYGLQSVHDATLRRIHRLHEFSCFEDTVKRTRSRGIDICVHVILGLPGEDKEAMLETARTLGRMDIQAISIHLADVIRETARHRLYEEGQIPMPGTRFRQRHRLRLSFVVPPCNDCP